MQKNMMILFPVKKLQPIENWTVTVPSWSYLLDVCFIATQNSLTFWCTIPIGGLHSVVNCLKMPPWRKCTWVVLYQSFSKSCKLKPETTLSSKCGAWSWGQPTSCACPGFILLSSTLRIANPAHWVHPEMAATVSKQKHHWSHTSAFHGASWSAIPSCYLHLNHHCLMHLLVVCSFCSGNTQQQRI